MILKPNRSIGQLFRGFLTLFSDGSDEKMHAPPWFLNNLEPILNQRE